jgi:type II secretion system protein G
MRGRGFTLIELLIVIAIILILIAIALPNFLEAQIRAKVTKGKAELRTLQTALEEYRIDFQMYPPDHDNDDMSQNGLYQITSPLKYLPSLPNDPFNQIGGGLETSGEPGTYEMGSTGLKPLQVWRNGGSFKVSDTYKKRNAIHAFVLMGAGPDGREDFDGNDNWPFAPGNNAASPCPAQGGMTYAPTNGTKSGGDLIQFGGDFRTGSYCMDGWQWVRGAGYER